MVGEARREGSWHRAEKEFPAKMALGARVPGCVLELEGSVLLPGFGSPAVPGVGPRAFIYQLSDLELGPWPLMSRGD